jgi:hypothetical protein
MDSSLEIAFRVADIQDLTFNQALSQVLGLDVDLIQKRVEEINTSRRLIMEQCVVAPPPSPVESPKCHVCHEYGDPFSEASKSAHFEHITMSPTDGCPTAQMETLKINDTVKACIRDNIMMDT